MMWGGGVVILFKWHFPISSHLLLAGMSCGGGWEPIQGMNRGHLHLKNSGGLTHSGEGGYARLLYKHSDE